MEHSHHCSYFNREEHLVDIAKENECDIVCFGHTHCSYFEKIDGVYLLNPGSTTFPRDGNPPSYAILDIEEDYVKAEIVFLEKKTKEKSPFGLLSKKNGVLGGIRTPDRSLRRRLLYPTELPRQLLNINR